MNKLLRHTFVVLMFRVDWRKLFFAGAVMTIAGVVLQNFILPHPLTAWLFSPLVTVSSENFLNNNLQLSETIPLETHKQIQGVTTTSAVLLNPMESNQSVPVMGERSKVSEKIGKEAKADDQPLVMLPPPPPPPPPPPRPSHRTVSGQLQVQLLCLL